MKKKVVITFEKGEKQKFLQILKSCNEKNEAKVKVKSEIDTDPITAAIAVDNFWKSVKGG